MADSSISNLPAGNPLAAVDLVPVDQLVSPGLYRTVKSTVSDVTTVVTNEIVNNPTLVTLLAGSLADTFVDTSGDTMTGNLVFDNALATQSWTISPAADDSLSLNGSTFNQTLVLNGGTDTVGNTGQTITGRFRYSMPIITQNTSATLGSGGSGVVTGLVRTSNAGAVTITIRANTSSLVDFSPGNFFSVMQEGAGQVTLVGETANVQLMIPTGYLAATRGQYSVISASLYNIAAGIQYWVISGDLAAVP